MLKQWYIYYISANITKCSSFSILFFDMETGSVMINEEFLKRGSLLKARRACRPQSKMHVMPHSRVIQDTHAWLCLFT
jgi:hypothetical protein